MYVYVDESGDSGISGKRGSSEYFVVAGVLFDTAEDATECRARIRELHRELGWGPRQEFKFNKSNRAVRLRFLRMVEGCRFRYLGVVLNKRALSGEGFRYKSSFYKYPTRLLFENAKPYLRNAVVVLDQSGGREFRNQMRVYLRKHTSDPQGAARIATVRTEKSHACELVQLADMVVGAVARSFDREKQDAAEYRACLRGHEIGVQFWPRG